MGLLFNCTLEVIDGVFKVNIDGEVVVNFEDQAVELDHLDQEASVFAARCYASVRHKPTWEGRLRGGDRGGAAAMEALVVYGPCCAGALDACDCAHVRNIYIFNKGPSVRSMLRYSC